MRINKAIAATLACVGTLLASLSAQAESDTSSDKSSKAEEGTTDNSSDADKSSDAEEDPDSTKAYDAVKARNAATTQPHVEGGPTSSKLSLGALFGYGFKDGVGLGFGARAGYTLSANVHLGATFQYHLGSSVSSPFGDISTSLYYFGLEGGYDIAVSPILIRPYLGFGRAVATVDTPENPVLGITANTASHGKFGFWPGVMAIYPMGRFFAGLDTRFLIVENFNAFSLSAAAGILL